MIVLAIRLDERFLRDFVSEDAAARMAKRVAAAQASLHRMEGPGHEFMGWLRLPQEYDRLEFDRIRQAAEKIRSDSDVLVVIGIGGSYLGARAVIEALGSPFYNSLPKRSPDILFAGQTISPSHLSDMLRLCEGRRFSINVVSKSGTTTEPALAFRFFRSLLEKQVGKEEARRRIYCTTDRSRGTLKSFADDEGYETFVVPDDIGGRYSVLSAVGLLPIAAAGFDIGELMAGAGDEMERLWRTDDHDCARYAAARNLLYEQGYAVELLVGYEPSLGMFCEWYKQLFGESEGKDQKGLFPASAIFSTDLHSMGQFIQEGSRLLFETVLWVETPAFDLLIPGDPQDIDGLNFLAGKPVSFVNEKARLGTLFAHTEGGVPNLCLSLPRLSERELGALCYFFEKACALSGSVLGVNPFDQPGVEAYKRNMFALLGKPGFEDRRRQLQSRMDL